MLISSCAACSQSYLIGIVVPDPEVFVDWAKERGFVGSHKELCQNPVRHMKPLFQNRTVLYAFHKQ